MMNGQASNIDRLEDKQMKSGWDNYASEKRYVQKGYFRKYSDGSSGRKTREASRRDSVQQSRKEQKEVAIQSYGKCVLLTEAVVPNEPFTADEAMALQIYENALKEAAPKLKEIENGQSEVGVGQPIQSSGKSGSEVRGSQSGSRGSKSRNGKVRKSKDGKDGSSRKEEG